MRSYPVKLVCVAAFLFLFSVVFAQTPENKVIKNILILYSHPLGTPFQDILSETLFETLSEDTLYDVRILTDFPWIAPVHDAAYSNFLSELYTRKYAGVVFDLIITTSTASTLFLLEFGDSIFPDIPVVSLPGPSTELTALISEKAGWTAVFSEKRIKETLDLALVMIPDTEDIYFLYGNSHNGQILGGAARTIAAAYPEHYNFHFVTDFKMSLILERLASLPHHSVVIYLTTLLDGNGEIFVPREILPRITAAANAPVYGLWDTVLGTGIIGGHMVSSHLDGISLSEVAREVLHGTDIDTIPVRKTITQTFIDWEVAKSWEIPLNNIPDDAIIVNRQDSLWDKYRRQIILVLFAVLVETLLVLLLFLQRYRLKISARRLENAYGQMELKVKTRTAELSASNKKLLAEIAEHKNAKTLIERLLAEKELILKEVHHRIKNNMMTLSSLISMETALSKNAEVNRILGKTNGRLKNMMILYDKLYRGSDFLNLDVKEYFSSLIAEIRDSVDVQGNIAIESDIDNFTLDSRKIEALGIIINEVVANAIKHAFPDNAKGAVFLTLTKSSEIITLVIEDNGIGLSGDIDYRNSSGFGLRLIDLLSDQLNGTIRIDRVNGTRFVLNFPAK